MMLEQLIQDTDIAVLALLDDGNRTERCAPPCLCAFPLEHVQPLLLQIGHRWPVDKWLHLGAACGLRPRQCQIQISAAGVGAGFQSLRPICPEMKVNRKIPLNPRQLIGFLKG